MTTDNQIILNCEEGGIMSLEQLIKENSEPDVDPLTEEDINIIRSLQVNESMYIVGKITRIK